MKYRKKPVVIEAIQLLPETFEIVCKFIPRGVLTSAYPDGCSLYIKTLEGGHVASKGDYIIKGIKGEFYPCKPDIFEMTYEAVND